MKLFLATSNSHKIEEIQDIFAQEKKPEKKPEKKIEILSIRDGIEIPEVIEDGKTFEDNSRKKALEIAKFTGLATVADDSGLCVEALNNEPGIFSARYSKEATDISNNKKLIENLKNIKNRSAKFVCVITLAFPDGKTYSYRGEISGEIIDEPRGSFGFGYDPHFYVEEYKKTLAEIPEIKSKISHRAKALEQMKEDVSSWFSD